MRQTLLYLSLFGPIAFASAVHRERSSYDASHLEEKKLKLSYSIKQRSDRDLQGPAIDLPVLSTAIQPVNDTAFVSFVAQAKGSLPKSMGKGGMSMGKGGMGMGKGGMGMGKGGMKMTYSPSNSLIPSTSLSPSPSLSISPTPSTTISPSPSLSSIVPSGSILPSVSITPTICEDDEDKGKMGMGKGGMSMGKGGMGMGMGKGGMSKSGKGGMMGMGKGECTDSPSATFSPSPSLSLSPSPSLSGSTITTCVPTSGTCASSASSLQNQIDLASAGSVIAICDGSLIESDTVFIIDQPSTTLCCAGTSCILSGLGTDSVLFVTGSSVTIDGITFQFGISTLFNGGNVAIEADGNHLISNSIFLEGNTSFAGGNLFVETTGTLTIEDSTFSSGEAQTGGGVVVLNATEVTVTNSVFADNSALNGGAFYYAGDTTVSTSPTINIEDSVFIRNTADVGGALLFVDIIDPVATISIVNNDFSENDASEAGGAGVFLAALADFDLTLDQNSGSANTAGFACDDFLAFLDAGGVDTQCIAVDQTL